MWDQIAPYFEMFPVRKRIAQKMLEYGLRVQGSKVYCATIELSDSKLARAFDVDRRVIKDTVDVIRKEPAITPIFERLQPTCHLREVASVMGWGVVEIVPNDPSTPGILAEVAALIAAESISIRQAISDDFEVSEEPRLYIITERPIPPSLIPKIRHARGVNAVMIY